MSRPHSRSNPHLDIPRKSVELEDRGAKELRECYRFDGMLDLY